MSNNVERFIDLTKNADSLKTKIIRIEEQCKSKEAELRKLVEEVKELGYKPNELKAVIEKKTKDLQEKEEAFEKDLQAISLKISEIEEG